MRVLSISFVYIDGLLTTNWMPKSLQKDPVRKSLVEPILSSIVLLRDLVCTNRFLFAQKGVCPTLFVQYI